MKVSVKTTRKIGLWTSISILIGSIIGIGIFFKNASIFNANNGYGINVLISWILAAVISTSTAFCFAEASSSDRAGGIGGWVEKLVGKKAGYFVKFNFNFFYFGLLITAVCIFVAEAIFNVFGITLTTPNFHFGYVMLLALVIIVGLLLLNFYATKVSQISQILLSSLKFVPIVLIILLGFVFYKNGTNMFVTDNVIKNNGGASNIGIVGILASLPAILFAFDSFTCIGSVGLEVKSKKTIPLSIVIAMVLVSIVYILITIVQILVGQGTIEGTFQEILKDNESAQIIFTYIVNVFMLVSILGVANSLILAGLRSFDNIAQQKIVVGYSWLANVSKGKQWLSGLILMSITLGSWFVLMAILSIGFNHDAFIDGLSNYATLFFFFIYGMVVLFTLINRFTNKVEVDKINIYLLVPVAIISLIGITLVFGYQFFYENIARVFIEHNTNSSWGVLYGPSDNKIKLWQVSIVFFSMLLLFMLLPIINYLIVRKKDGNGLVVKNQEESKQWLNK